MGAVGSWYRYLPRVDASAFQSHGWTNVAAVQFSGAKQVPPSHTSASKAHASRSYWHWLWLSPSSQGVS